MLAGRFRNQNDIFSLSLRKQPWHYFPHITKIWAKEFSSFSSARDNRSSKQDTVEPFYNGHLRTELSGLCKEVAVMGRFSIEEDLSEWIRSRDMKTWPLKRGGRCGEVTVGGGSTVFTAETVCWVPMNGQLIGRFRTNRLPFSHKSVDVNWHDQLKDRVSEVSEVMFWTKANFSQSEL